MDDTLEWRTSWCVFSPALKHIRPVIRFPWQLRERDYSIRAERVGRSVAGSNQQFWGKGQVKSMTSTPILDRYFWPRIDEWQWWVQRNLSWESKESEETLLNIFSGMVTLQPVVVWFLTYEWRDANITGFVDSSSHTCCLWIAYLKVNAGS